MEQGDSHTAGDFQTRPAPNVPTTATTSNSSSLEATASDQDSSNHSIRLINYPFNAQRIIDESKLRGVSHRQDERLVVELINAPFSVPIPRVDMVLLYNKDASAAELSRVKSFHGALINEWGLKINTYRDKDGPYLYSKLYIPFNVLKSFSDFHFPSENDYNAVQRSYAIEKILNTAVVLTKFRTDKKYKRYDYRRMIDEGIITAAYIPHDPQANDQLLQSWAMLTNIFKAQPIQQIKDYFGASIAIHFAWCGYFNAALLLGCLFGLVGYIGSLIVSHGQYDYPIEEVCAGVYDYYPRCPLCEQCDFSPLSDSCKARRDLRNKSNILFCILMSFWIGTLLTSFSEYLSRITQFWEDPFTTQDVHVYHLAIVKQAKSSAYHSNIEPVRISYLKKYPKLMEAYEQTKPQTEEFAEQCNVSFHQITLENLNTSCAADDSNHSDMQTRDENDNEINKTVLSPEEFEAIKDQQIEDDELGFAMKPNAMPSDSRFESAEADARRQAYNQENQMYQLQGWQAVRHTLVAWSMTLAFFIYFALIFWLYVRILGHIKSSAFYLPLANALLNLVMRTVHRRVVYYLTKWQVPMYQSQFNKWMSVKLILCYLTEYTYFFYTAIFAEFYYSIPNRIKDPPLKTKPCLQDDCHYSLSLSFARILTVDQFVSLLNSFFWPGFPTEIFGFDRCHRSKTLTQLAMSVNKSIRKIRRKAMLLIWDEREISPPRKKSFSMSTQSGTWLTDSPLFDYWTQPFLLESYMKVIPLLGYAALFAANWFWSPFMLFIFSALYNRIQAYHLLKHYRRPLPERAKGLGFWERFIGYMVLASFVVNGFIFSFLSDIVTQTLRLANNGTLRGYVNTTLSFYEAKNISALLGLTPPNRDYCIFNGNLEPPWAENAFTVNSVGCFRLFYKLLFFIIYAAVFYMFCRWMRYDLAWLFQNLFELTESLSSPLLNQLTYFLIPGGETKIRRHYVNPLAIEMATLDHSTSAAECQNESSNRIQVTER